mgnify:CR=1 FL=1
MCAAEGAIPKKDEPACRQLHASGPSRKRARSQRRLVQQQLFGAAAAVAEAPMFPLHPSRVSLSLPFPKKKKVTSLLYRGNQPGGGSQFVFVSCQQPPPSIAWAHKTPPDFVAGAASCGFVFGILWNSIFCLYLFFNGKMQSNFEIPLFRIFKMAGPSPCTGN